MDTLINVHPRRGGKDPSHTGLTSDVSPEVQSLQAENSHTGVSSNFVPEPKKQWFVLRATYGRTDKACEELEKGSVRTYASTHYALRDINGKKKRMKMPLLPNIIFARMSRLQANTFLKAPAPTASYLKFYLDKTKEAETKTGLNPPVVIPDAQMDNFISATSVSSEHSMMFPKERVHYKSGDIVRVTKGDFKGIVGKVARVAGQQRVAIDMDALGTFVTAYIPNDFMEQLGLEGGKEKVKSLIRYAMIIHIFSALSEKLTERRLNTNKVNELMYYEVSNAVCLN